MSPNLTPRSAGPDLEPRGPKHSSRRYPVQFDLRYKILQGGRVIERGLGKTWEFSGGSVSFRSDRILPEGSDLELCLDWPLRVNGVSPLHLIIFGKITSGAQNWNTAKIGRYEFRARSTHPIAPSETVRRSGFQIHAGTRLVQSRQG